MPGAPASRSRSPSLTEAAQAVLERGLRRLAARLRRARRQPAPDAAPSTSPGPGPAPASTPAAAAPSVAPQAVRTLNLALQGGGAHGAFTWGVLERLLAEPGLRFGAISGSSAGAVNGVLLAAGLLDGGRAGARDKLEAFWRGISLASSSEVMSAGLLDAPPGGWLNPGPMLDVMSRFLSPYQFNPLDYNPLRHRLEELVDWKRLRRSSPLPLFVAATDIADGRSRIFTTRELSLEAVLASASLPHVHRAVEVDGRHFWDGGFAANPALQPLVFEAEAADTLLVQLIPFAAADVPTKLPQIRERVNQIVFTSHLRREIELIAFGQRIAGDAPDAASPLQRRLAEHRFHHIDGTPYTHALAPGSRLSPDWRLISQLREGGREAAEAWLAGHLDAVGHAATADLAATLL